MSFWAVNELGMAASCESHLDGAIAGNEYAESRWCTQTLLTRGYHHVNTPFIHLDQLARDGADTVQNYLMILISGLIVDNLKGCTYKCLGRNLLCEGRD